MDFKIVQVDKKTSKNGNPYSVYWVQLPSGLPGKITDFNSSREYEAGQMASAELALDGYANVIVRLR